MNPHKTIELAAGILFLLGEYKLSVNLVSLYFRGVNFKFLSTTFEKNPILLVLYCIVAYTHDPWTRIEVLA